MKAYQIESIPRNQSRYIDISLDRLKNKTIHVFFPEEIFTILDFGYSQVINTEDIALYYKVDSKYGDVYGSIILIDGMNELELITKFIYRSIFKLKEDGIADRVPNKSEINNKLLLWR